MLTYNHEEESNNVLFSVVDYYEKYFLILSTLTSIDGTKDLNHTSLFRGMTRHWSQYGNPSDIFAYGKIFLKFILQNFPQNLPLISTIMDYKFKVGSTFRVHVVGPTM